MIVPVKTYLKVWAALLGLLVLTIGVAFLQLGRLNLPIAMLISVAKAALIVLVFMHIKGGSRLLHLAAAAGLLWLSIMFVLTMNDYLTRDAVTWLTR
jgi:cytochrome c oxidase subunit IV